MAMDLYFYSRRVWGYLFSLLFLGVALSKASDSIFPLKSAAPISPFRLQQENGKPFFLVADVVWELPARSSREDVQVLLKRRADQGFTGIAISLLPSLSGTGTNLYGHRPCEGSVDRIISNPENNPADPSQYDYWDHVEFILEEAARQKLLVLLSPVAKPHGNPSGRGRVVDLQNAQEYGRYCGARFSKPNVLWLLGPDLGGAEAETWSQFNQNLARGLALGVTGKPDYSTLPIASASSATASFATLLNVPVDRDRPEFHQALSGAVAAKKPFIVSSPLLEDWKRSWGRVEASDVRKLFYWSFLGGAAGHFYGHISTIQMHRPGQFPWEGPQMAWNEALQSSFGADLQVLKNLLLNRPWNTLRPEPGLITEQRQGGNYIAAARGDGFVLIYSSNGQPFQFKGAGAELSKFQAWWIDPRTGVATPLQNKSVTGQFTPPSEGRGNDWLLLLEDPARNFPKPETLPSTN